MRRRLLIAPKRLRPRPWLADITPNIITITIMRQLPKVARPQKAAQLELLVRPELPARLVILVRLEQLAPRAPRALRLRLLPLRNIVSQFV